MEVVELHEEERIKEKVVLPVCDVRIENALLNYSPSQKENSDNFYSYDLEPT